MITTMNYQINKNKETKLKMSMQESHIEIIFLARKNSQRAQSKLLREAMEETKADQVEKRF